MFSIEAFVGLCDQYICAVVFSNRAIVLRIEALWGLCVQCRCAVVFQYRGIVGLCVHCRCVVVFSIEALCLSVNVLCSV